MSDPILHILLETYKQTLDIEREITEGLIPLGDHSKIALSHIDNSMAHLHLASSLLGRADIPQHLQTLTVKIDQIKRLAQHRGIMPQSISPQQSVITYLNYQVTSTGFICFYDEKYDRQTAFLGNFFPCSMEFGGIVYTGCAEAVYQAQKCSNDQDKKAFADADGDVAFTMGKSIRMANPFDWNQRRQDIMMNVLRAKFGQNPLLKELLLATGNAFLVEHNVIKGRDSFWSDDFDGSGMNRLGMLLMQLRNEVGGTGVVDPPLSLQNLYVSPPQCAYTTSSVPAHSAYVDKQHRAYKFCSQDHSQAFYAHCSLYSFLKEKTTK